jgi:putative transposase
MPSSLKRYQTEGHYHFLTFSCYHRLPKLNDDRARIVFEQKLEGIRRRHRLFVFGYVLMPEHVHLLLTEPTVYSLVTSISVLKGETAKVLKIGSVPFWQARYYDFNVFTQVKFVEKLRYIHRNPVERGLVEKPEDWPWSSFRHWALGEVGRVEIESHWTWDRRERELVDGGRTSGSAIPPMRKERA